MPFLTASLQKALLPGVSPIKKYMVLVLLVLVFFLPNAVFSTLFVEKKTMDIVFSKNRKYFCVLNTCQSEIYCGFFPYCGG